MKIMLMAMTLFLLWGQVTFYSLAAQPDISSGNVKVSKFAQPDISSGNVKVSKFAQTEISSGMHFFRLINSP